MREVFLIVLLAVPQLSTEGPVDIETIFQNGRTWEQFLTSVSERREMWTKTDSAVTVPPEFVERVSASSRGLRIVVVAEDWCPDSAFAVPYIARLAQSSGVPLRVVNRAAGEPLMTAHRTPDGRTATPTIVLVRNGRDVGAWVERPTELQDLFLSMSTNAESKRRFSERHTWYESDGGLSTLREVVALIERTRDKE